MAIRGQKPKPTHLRLLDGGADRRGVDRSLEPRPEPAQCLPPDRLTEEQKALYREAFGWAPPGMLTGLDMFMFEPWIAYTLRMRAAEVLINKFGPYTKNKAVDHIRNPACIEYERCERAASRLASEMGFSPTSRTRVKISRSAKKPSSFGDLKEFEP